jgi:hypothetical protein
LVDAVSPLANDSQELYFAAVQDLPALNQWSFRFSRFNQFKFREVPNLLIVLHLLTCCCVHFSLTHGNQVFVTENAFEIGVLHHGLICNFAKTSTIETAGSVESLSSSSTSASTMVPSTRFENEQEYYHG